MHETGRCVPNEKLVHQRNWNIMPYEILMIAIFTSSISTNSPCRHGNAGKNLFLLCCPRVLVIWLAWQNLANGYGMPLCRQVQEKDLYLTSFILVLFPISKYLNVMTLIFPKLSLNLHSERSSSYPQSSGRAFPPIYLCPKVKPRTLQHGTPCTTAKTFQHRTSCMPYFPTFTAKINHM